MSQGNQIQTPTAFASVPPPTPPAPQSRDLNCGRGRVFGRIAFIAVADITDAIAVIAAGFGSSGLGRCRYRYITTAISVTDRYLNPCLNLLQIHRQVNTCSQVVMNLYSRHSHSLGLKATNHQVLSFTVKTLNQHCLYRDSELHLKNHIISTSTWWDKVLGFTANPSTDAIKIFKAEMGMYNVNYLENFRLESRASSAPSLV
ncbi:hypothetical protein GOBAR_AA36409 [Gossypium barbadense]|uniref:Uncharacterized protein n=1 Tax=Gossypium barbadense TaxID=3634 RepID=A0A2P5VZQ2_GOSBA|nr:hypothetical protein GOBAR_AA36409 [Gossypium barbadense]